MNRRQCLTVALAFLAVTAFATSSSGFTTATTDRGVSVDVAEDANAYLGFEQTRDSNETATTNGTQRVDANGTTHVDVTVTNQFPAGTELATIEVTVNGTAVDIGPLAAGERVTRAFSSVSCGDSIVIVASGVEVTVRFTRTIPCG